MIKVHATGTVDFLIEGRRKYYFIQADVKDPGAWPFPVDAFPIYRKKSRNKKFKKDDRVAFLAIEKDGELKAWKIRKLSGD